MWRVLAGGEKHGLVGGEGEGLHDDQPGKEPPVP